jgi:hypothetical protein
MYFIGKLISDLVVIETIVMIVSLRANFFEVDHQQHASTASGHHKYNWCINMARAIE